MAIPPPPPFFHLFKFFVIISRPSLLASSTLHLKGNKKKIVIDQALEYCYCPTNNPSSIFYLLVLIYCYKSC